MTDAKTVAQRSAGMASFLWKLKKKKKNSLGEGQLKQVANAGNKPGAPRKRWVCSGSRGLKSKTAERVRRNKERRKRVRDGGSSWAPPPGADSAQAPARGQLRAHGAGDRSSTGLTGAPGGAQTLALPLPPRCLTTIGCSDLALAPPPHNRCPSTIGTAPPTTAPQPLAAQTLPLPLSR